DDRADPLAPPRPDRPDLRVPGDALLPLDLVAERRLELRGPQRRRQEDPPFPADVVQLRRDDPLLVRERLRLGERGAPAVAEQEPPRAAGSLPTQPVRKRQGEEHPRRLDVTGLDPQSERL